jgi:hypothetical protein
MISAGVYFFTPCGGCAACVIAAPRDRRDLVGA